METLIKATKKLMDAVIKLHPNLHMDNSNEEALYMAYHDCRNIIEGKAKCTIPIVSGSLPLASGTVTKTREPLPTYHNKCDLCGEIFWTKDAFNNKCPECGREGWQSNDR